MVLRNERNGWTVEGMYLTVLPAFRAVDDIEMISYYRMDKSHSQYEVLRKPCSFDRFVVMKPNGDFIIVPINSNVEIVE